MPSRLPRIGIVGAGAIGRGFVGRVLHRAGCEVHLVDRDERIVSRLARQGRYLSAMTIQDGERLAYSEQVVPVASASLPSAEVIAAFDLIVLAVGPRNVPGLAPLLAEARGPIVCMENDRGIVRYLGLVLGRSDVHFSVPDVITSCTAPEHLLERDPFAIATEQGQLFVEAEGLPLPPDFVQITAAEMDVQWNAKFYIHNTPHAVAAYLGARRSFRYLHEVLAVPELAAIVRGSVDEMVEMVSRLEMVPLDFARWYGEKELSRFSNTLLCDPIARVAREPLRKLERGGRLIGAAELALAAGVMPRNLLEGIMAAVEYEDASDVQLSVLRRALPSEDFIAYALGLQEGHPLRHVLSRRLEGTRA